MLHLIAARTGRPSDDPIFALNQEANERKARGEAIINATVGALLDDEGRLLVLPTAARAVREVAEGDWAAYAPISGNAPFLAAVADDLFATSPTLKRTAVVVATPGGSGALRHAIANYLEPGQALLTTSAFWGPYQTLSDEADRQLETFRMFDANGELDVAALDEAIARQIATQGRVLLFLNDPCHNPTGYSMHEGEWRQVAHVLEKHAATAPLTLLVDLAYFQYGNREPRAFLSVVEPLLGKVGLLFAWSASKTFTHYGLRVGALVACVGDDKERAQTQAALSYSSRGTWSNCNRGGQHAITHLLANRDAAAACDKERAAAKASLLARVDAWNREATKRGLVYPRYEGGFFVTVFVADALDRAVRMKNRGAFVVPSKGALRVALCSVAERDVAKLVEAIAES